MKARKQHLTTGLRITLATTASLMLMLSANAQDRKPLRNAKVTVLETPPAREPENNGPQPAVSETSAKIDALVEQKLIAEKVSPNAMSSDEVFLRRIYLDISGRVPTKAETLTFLDSKDADKRVKLIDQLLAGDGYVQNYFNFWADILRVKNGIAPGGQGRESGAAYIQWLKESLRENKPYDRMVRELLTADGASYEDGATGFYMRDMGMPLDNMAVTTQIFLGTQMVCAQCHDHPFDRWTQMDYFQMAAHSQGMTGTNALANTAEVNRFLAQNKIFGDDRKTVNRAFSDILFRLRFNHVFALDRALKLPGDYQYKDAKPNDLVEPTIPAAFGKSGQTDKIVKAGETPILAYAQWMTSRENPRFTLVIANRLWKKVMGMGVIDPVDEITDSTVPSNPALMTFLEQTLKDVNYDMKAYLRILLNSKTYQREATASDVELGAAYHFPGPLLRRMSAEQIWDSIVALAKENPDEASHATFLETRQMLTKVEWMDRMILVQSPQNLVEGARQIAAYQKELTTDVQAKTIAMKAAVEAKDEKKIREFKEAAKSQRAKVFAKSDEIVFNNGFQQFAKLVIEDPDAAFESQGPFAEQVADAIEHFGKVPTVKEAVNYVLDQQKADYRIWRETMQNREMKTWGVKTPDQRKTYRNFSDYRERNFVRSADLRNPAPNGHFLRIYGQSDREIVDNFSKEASVMQALTMMNGSLFRMLLSPYSVVNREMQKDVSQDEIIDTIYLSTLSRHATEEEKGLLRPMLEGKPFEGRGDILWTVLNTRQFLFIQ